MQLNFSREGYDGTMFNDFYVTRDGSAGPGWFIFGRDPQKYGAHPDGRGRYVMLCGYRTRRKHVHYNGKVRHGWRTKREALAMLRSYVAEHPQFDFRIDEAA